MTDDKRGHEKIPDASELQRSIHYPVKLPQKENDPSTTQQSAKTESTSSENEGSSKK